MVAASEPAAALGGEREALQQVIDRHGIAAQRGEELERPRQGGRSCNVAACGCAPMSRFTSSRCARASIPPRRVELAVGVPQPEEALARGGFVGAVGARASPKISPAATSKLTSRTAATAL